MAYLIIAEEIWDRGAQTLCPSVTVLLLPNINEHIVLLWKYQMINFKVNYTEV